MFLHFPVFLQIRNQDLVRYFTTLSIGATFGKEIICSAKCLLQLGGGIQWNRYCLCVIAGLANMNCLNELLPLQVRLEINGLQTAKQ